ncbi:Putative amidase [Cladobotryum mycophilum]|uniref:Amidase n=1 Tax=Cladobotryum mycophilum TaxID=491253 RepID=A0ABR0SZ92_9HYPO
MRIAHLSKAVLRLACLAPLVRYCTAAPANYVFPPLLDATLADLRDGLDGGHFTSVDLVEAYLARINEVNSELHAVTEINPDAVSIAAELDCERQRGIINSTALPLHGIPILVKNNIATDDKMNNTAGSYALLGAKVPEDSTVVAKLRKAGAIILGKSNLSQWASCRELDSHEGWSAHGGQTVGAYFPKQNPRGSSSGSGVATSLGLAWAALGTDTGGSIILPSHAGNLVGFRPTVGLTSRYLVVPYSERQDTIGPMARTVKDAAYLMQAIAGRDQKDNYTSAIPFEQVPDYVGACKSSGLKGKRLGVSRNMIARGIDASSHTAPEAFEHALDVLREAGAEIIDNVDLPCAIALTNETVHKGPTGPSTPGADFLSDIPKYMKLLKTNPNNITSVEDMRAFTQSFPQEQYPKYDTTEWDVYIETGMYNTSPEFWELLTVVREYLGPGCFTGAMEKHSLDAMVLPAVYTILTSSGLGLPTVTVPLGRAPDNAPIVPAEAGDLVSSAPNGPFGLGFAGPAFSEEMLFGMAYDFEQRTRVRETIRPYVQPRTELVDVVRKRCWADKRGVGCGLVM